MKLNTESQIIKHFIFKSGENHVQLLSNFAGHEIDLFFRYAGDQSLFKLAMIVDALKRQGYVDLSLTIPYFPGARQDRVCNSGEALSVKVYADFINNMGFRRVSVFDPHSDVVAAVVNNCRVEKNHAFVMKALDWGFDRFNYTLVSPDAGANKKIFDLARILGGAKVIRADKIRDVTNGSIIGTEVFADDLTGETCYIVDDICAGGRTFIELAKKLKEKNAAKVILIVSHYEGVANKTLLKESGIDKVITTNSLPNACLTSDDFLEVYEINELI